MKRSEINRILADAVQFFDQMNFKLPEWGYWSLKEWKANSENWEEIFQNGLGWDITDFGSNLFYERGLLLFTIRNGNLKFDKKPYAEKIMIVEEEQETPMHFHWSKMEDIINRGGGNLTMELYNADADENLLQTPVTVKIDGIPVTVDAGNPLILKPGQSICLEQRLYHRFYGEAGKGKVLVGEVSAVNNDHTDNRFHQPVGRFPEIEEDEAPLYLLVGDYERFI